MAVLRDLAVMLADGGDCLSDPDGLARLRAARAHARARAWAAGAHPDRELLVVDATRPWWWPTAMPSRARQAPTSTL